MMIIDDHDRDLVHFAFPYQRLRALSIGMGRDTHVPRSGKTSTLPFFPDILYC